MSFWAVLALIVVANAVLDPFQLFHRDWVRPTTYVGAGAGGLDRYEARAVIDHYPAAAYILGSSYAANFRPELVRKLFAVTDARNLTMSGSDIREQHIVLQRALQRGGVELVIWQVDPAYFAVAEEQLSPQFPFPDQLYDGSRWNDLQQLLSTSNLRYAWDKQRQRLGCCEGLARATWEQRQLDRRTQWYPLRQRDFDDPGRVACMALREHLDDYAQLVAKPDAPPAAALLQQASGESRALFRANVRRYIGTLAERYPRTRFLVVTTPWSTLLQQRWRAAETATYLSRLQAMHQLTLDASAWSNVGVHAFHLEPFTDDLRGYMDPSHYSLAVSDLILDKLARGENRLTRGNIEPFVLALDRKVAGYRAPTPWLRAGHRARIPQADGSHACRLPRSTQ